MMVWIWQRIWRRSNTLSAVRCNCRTSSWIGHRATLAKRAFWRESLLVERLLHDQVVRFWIFICNLLYALLLLILSLICLVLFVWHLCLGENTYFHELA